MQATFYATLRQIVGGKTAVFDLPENATVRQLLDEMIRRYPGLRRELCDEQGQLYRHVHVFINGRDAPYLENGLETTLSSDDIVSIFPAVAGG